MTAELSQYLPFIVAAGAIICIALWLLFGPSKSTVAPVETEAKPEVATPAVSAPKAEAPAKPKAEVKSPAAKTAAPKAAAPKAAKPKTAPKVAAPKAAAPKAAKAAKGPDNLRLIKGLGPKLNTLLNDLGVTRFDQIAGLDAKAVAALDAKLGTFAGRITRDNFVDQAGLLAKGDVAGFEAKYGKLDGSL